MNANAGLALVIGLAGMLTGGVVVPTLAPARGAAIPRDRQEVLLGGSAPCNGTENLSIACDPKGPNGNCPAVTRGECVRYLMSDDQCVHYSTAINNKCVDQEVPTMECVATNTNDTCGTLVFGKRNMTTGKCLGCENPNSEQCGAVLVTTTVSKCRPGDFESLR